nr:MAG: DNA gyrase inhibitor YacG [Hyphomicrobiales bacterium]
MSDPKCPICKKPASEAHKPFCSKRCAHLDLGRWLNEGYAIPAIEPPEDEEEPSVPPDKESYH